MTLLETIGWCVQVLAPAAVGIYVAVTFEHHEGHERVMPLGGERPPRSAWTA
jgi:hypothetical protein